MVNGNSYKQKRDPERVGEVKTPFGRLSAGVTGQPGEVKFFTDPGTPCHSVKNRGPGENMLQPDLHPDQSGEVNEQPGEAGERQYVMEKRPGEDETGQNEVTVDMEEVERGSEELEEKPKQFIDCSIAEKS